MRNVIAAASARLCVETRERVPNKLSKMQPPPRGCVLKLIAAEWFGLVLGQPPPRGCVLKQRRWQ